MTTNKKNTAPRNPFNVPDEYFNNFESRLIQNKEIKTNPFITKKSKLIAPWITMAAAFLLIALVYSLIPQKITNSKLVKQNETYNIIEYTATDYFNEFELMSILADEDNADCQLYPDSLFFKDISEEDIIILTSLR